MSIELSGIARALRWPNGRSITLHVTGVGRRRTQASLGEIVKREPSGIIMAGFCGGANPDLAVGDLHVARSFAGPVGCDQIAADGNLFSALSAAAEAGDTRVSSAQSATVDEILGVAEKRELYRQRGMDSVNMEDYWAARTAADAGLPFASVRAVLDASDQELPRYLTGETGNVAAAWGLATHPRRAPAMWKLARRARTARRSLTRCVVGALGSGTLILGVRLGVGG